MREGKEGNLIRGGVVIHPSLLKYPKLNYVKVRKDGKGCLEKRWPSRVMRFDNFSLGEHLKNGGNLGVQTNNSFVEIKGVGRQLIILDFDNREFQDKVLDKFPRTFTTTSGSKKNCLHVWLGTDRQEKKFAILDKEGNTLADVLGEHGQVVAPNSKHSGGSIYKVISDEPIAYMFYEDILSILKPYQEGKELVPYPIKPHKDYGTNSFWGLVRSRINVIDILNSEGIDTSKNPTECPFHSSVSGECLSFTEEVWRCHHNGCDKKGNLFILVKELKKLTTKETFEWLADETELEDELMQYRIDYMKGVEDGKT